MFQLNILKAGSGDSILIKYKSGNSEKHILIDGGVGKIYEKELKHLMDTLSKLNLGDSLTISLRVVFLPLILITILSCSFIKVTIFSYLFLEINLFS